MSGVDNRIVTMQFNNSQFEANARTSLSTLQRLKESMNFKSISTGALKGLGSIGTALGKFGKMTPFAPLITGAQKGFGFIGGVIDKLGLKNPFRSGVAGAGELQRAAQGAAGPGGLGMLEGGVTGISNKFLALSTIAITALSNITTKAMQAGGAWLKSFTVAPIMDGLHEYQTTLQSIQTVQANTDRPLKEIENSLKDLNAYSDTTIYNFGEMAKNVGTFTAAGVNLKDSVASIKGIANVAALSGSNSQQAAGAMYQLSQAIAAGKVGAQDWNSVVNAGMAGKKLQTALARTAVVMGALDKSAVTTNKSTGALMVNSESFKNSIMAKPGQESWLSSGVLVNTLASLDGRFSTAYQKAQLLENGTRRFTDAQIKSNMVEARANLEKKLGHKFSDQQFADLQKMAEASTKAAQDVKTLGQVFDIAKETIGSGWAASFKSIFGNLDQSKKLFTDMSNGLGDIIRKNALARNELLASWSKSSFGGRATLIAGLTTVWKAFYSVVQAIGKGLRDVFPKKTVADLQSMTMSFAAFAQKLTPSTETLAHIRDIAGGVFAVFSIGKTILGGIITMFKTMFTTVGGGNGDFLEFAGGIGNAIKSFDDFLKKSGIVTAFFEGLGKILAIPLGILKGFGSIISGIFGGFDSGAADKLGSTIGGIGDRLSGLEVIGDRIKNFFTHLGDLFGGIGKKIGNALVGIGDMIAGAFTPETFGATLDVINTSLLGALVLLIKKFFSKGVNIDLTGGLFDGIKETLGAATSAFTTMQQNLKANILLKLAAAIGVMALALLVLSGIDPAALTKALAAMTGGFGILIGAMATLLKVMGPAGLVQLYVITAAMTKMALSILLLSFALKILAGIKFGDMLRGLVGLAAMMFILSKVMPILAKNSAGMGKAAGSLILLGIALNLLAIALKVMATMSWEEMAKGLLTMTGALVGIALAMKLMPKGMLLQAASILILSVALNALGVALKIFGSMSWESMIKGIVMLAGSLVVIGLAMRLMPTSLPLTAAGLLIVAMAMTVLAGALKIMGSMGWEEIAKGLLVMAGSLVIIGVALKLFGASGVLGAAALLIVATAMTSLLPVLLAFGAMDWGTILKSLTMLAGIFVVLGLAGYLLAPVVVVILGLGAAMLLMGAGLMMAGAGALMAATAIGILVAAGAAGIQIFMAYLGVIVKAIPGLAAAFAKGFVAFVVAIGSAAPQLALAMFKVMNAMLTQVQKALPKIGRIMLQLVNLAINVVARSVPRLANAGMKMILGLINAANKNIGKIINTAATLIVNFLNGISRNLPRIIQAGIRLIISFVNGVANGIRNNKNQMADAGRNLASALIEATAAGLRSGAHLIKDAAMAAARSAWQAAKDFFKIGGPSKLMCETVGKPIAEGWAGGVSQAGSRVVDEIGLLGEVSVSKMEEAMRGISDAFALDGNLNPTISPVLDLTALTQEANKMSSILAQAPIMPSVSYQTASDISSLTGSSPDDGRGGPGSGGGDTYVNLTQELHSPKPIDSVEAYRGGKTLISLAKEALK